MLYTVRIVLLYTNARARRVNNRCTDDTRHPPLHPCVGPRRRGRLQLLWIELSTATSRPRVINDGAQSAICEDKRRSFPAKSNFQILCTLLCFMVAYIMRGLITVYFEHSVFTH